MIQQTLPLCNVYTLYAIQTLHRLQQLRSVFNLY